MLCRSVLVCCLLIQLVVASGSATASDDALARPRIGLVLAGGGAKGGAHVGVLKALEEQRVPVDCIAGTSMGALVGGGYASGMPAAEIEKFLLSINWRRVVGSQGGRDLEPIEQKRAGDTYSNDFEIGVTGRGMRSPAGLINTGKVEDLLRLYVANARLETEFDRLPIPFRAVTTDMVSGRMVALREGDLATAMRASMAIPGAFAPVTMDNMVLADGGLVRNIPIDVARETCADVVIVVNLVEPAVDPEKLQSAAQLLGRTLDVIIIANEELQLRTLRDGDVRIDVDVGTIGAADFERVPETVPLGEAAAKAMSPALSQYALSPQEYQAWRQSVTTSQEFNIKLAGVRFEGLERVNSEYLSHVSKLKAGDIVAAETISREAQKLAALGDLDTVGYRLDGDRQSPTLTWLPREKLWGPDYLNFDLGTYASSQGDLMFVLYGRHRRSWLNSLGAQWRNEVQVGSQTLIATSFFQPLDQAHQFFVEPRASYLRSLEDVFHEGSRVARYQFRNSVAALDFGLNLGPYAQARAGYVYDDRSVDLDIGSSSLPEGDHIDAGWSASFVYDSRDTAFKPTRGIAAALEYMNSDDSLGASRNWQRVEGGLGLAIPLRRDVLWFTTAGGNKLSTDLPPDRAFALGGPGSLPGYEFGELRVDSYWTVSANYLWKVREALPMRNLALYAGIGLTGGAVSDPIDEGSAGDIYSAAFYLTGRSLLGPFTFGIATTSRDSWSAWLGFGRPVGNGTILERGIFR